MTRLATIPLLALALCAPAHAKPKTPTPLAPSIADANAAALQTTKDAALVGAQHEFAFETGGLYAITAGPQRITDITLEAGETLLSVSAGDTTRWIVGDARSGSGPTGQAHVLVKPNAAGLSTNLVIMTDRRVYHIELSSTSGPAMAAASWRYPAEMSLALAAPKEPELAISVDRLDFNYLMGGDRPSWKPVRVFNDGRQTFIEMPATVGESDAPPLFVIGDEGAQLVNYRLVGRYYVVDRLFDRAELRLGSKKKKVVTLTRFKGDKRHD